MQNQSFSADNFRKIFDYQNRKGINLESEFFPDVKELSSQLKDIKVKFKERSLKEPEVTIMLKNMKRKRISSIELRKSEQIKKKSY